MINNFFDYALKDLYLDNRIGLQNIVNKYLKQNNIDFSEKQFDFIESIKNLTTFDDKMNAVIEHSEPKITKLNKIRYVLLKYYLGPNTIDGTDSILKNIKETTIESTNLSLKLKCLETRKNHRWNKLLLEE